MKTRTKNKIKLGSAMGVLCVLGLIFVIGVSCLLLSFITWNVQLNPIDINIVARFLLVIFVLGFTVGYMMNEKHWIEDIKMIKIRKTDELRIRC